MKPIIAKDIKSYLEKKHNQKHLDYWSSIGFDELSLEDNGSLASRLDYWAIECWQSKKYARYAYEIKVSRSDWLSELKKPEKRRLGMFVSNEFYFIAPKGIIKLEEVPTICGLIEVEWVDNQKDINLMESQLELPDKMRAFKYKDCFKPIVPEYKQELKAMEVRKALWRDEAFPTWRLIASICRRAKGKGNE